MRPAVAVMLLLIAGVAQADWAGAIDRTLWSIDAEPGVRRWIEMHGIDDAKKSGVYHIEVLELRSGDAPSRVRHVVPHMAITEAALRRSVRAPRDRGSVYPETFDQAYARWLKNQAEGISPICSSSVVECLN